MNNFLNRRRFRRAPLTTQVVCEGSGTTACVISTNVSEGGILLNTARFYPGDEVSVSFLLPQINVIRRVGIVVWRDVRGGSIGIQFAAGSEATTAPAAA